VNKVFVPDAPEAIEQVLAQIATAPVDDPIIVRGAFPERQYAPSP
jgi:hypothetical protein